MPGFPLDLYFDIFGIMKSSRAVAALGALAQESRLAVFRVLVKRGPAGYTPSELSDKLGIPPPTLSFHLKGLQQAGLLDVRREGRHLYYTANFAHMNVLVAYLTDHCCSLADTACDAVTCTPLEAGARQSSA
jgi:ArsR family transcriptional regulator, arsenate/arsenite/antimonite-responsive transcriptional repressor